MPSLTLCAALLLCQTASRAALLLSLPLAVVLPLGRHMLICVGWLAAASIYHALALAILLLILLHLLVYVHNS